MPSCEQLKANLCAAELAYHNYQLSGQVTEITSSSKTIRWGKGDIDGLVRYISSLRDQVNACSGLPSTRRSAIRFAPSDC